MFAYYYYHMLGVLVTWDLVTNTTKKLNYGKHVIYCLAVHPYDPEVAAFGCKLGLVLIVNLSGSGRVLQRMRGHDEDVYALAWSPSDQTQVSPGESSVVDPELFISDPATNYKLLSLKKESINTGICHFAFHTKCTVRQYYSTVQNPQA